MKKFNDTNVGLFVLLTTCLSLFSCNNDNDNFPKDYVGFEKSTRTIECDKNQSESELQIKIIAADKSKEDRTVLLTTTIKFYPQKMILKQQNVTLSCTPQWKEGGISKLTILLKRK